MLQMKDMPYHCGLKVKIYPSNEQKRIIAANDGAKRAVYNHLVACRNETYRLNKCAAFVPTYQERLEYLRSVSDSAKGIKNAMPFLYGNDIDDQVIANTIRNYQAAWKNRKQLHMGVPVFKKKSTEQSYQTNAHYYSKATSSGHISNVKFEDSSHVVLPKLGRIRFAGSPKSVREMLERPLNIRIGTIQISRDAVGEYWASFQLGSELPFRQPLPKTGSEHGLDLNLLELVNGSDGSSCENKHFFRLAEDKLAKEQRKLSRMAEHAKKESRKLTDCKNYQEQRKKVAYLHRKTARQREDYLHVLSKREVENQDFIAAEDLKVRNLLKNHCLAKSIADAGWRKFLIMLQYKGRMYGKTVVLVPPRNTTQTCSVCGYVLKGKEKLHLSVREWDCPICHVHHQRDMNAAQVILQKAKSAAKQKECPA